MDGSRASEMKDVWPLIFEALMFHELIALKRTCRFLYQTIHKDKVYINMKAAWNKGDVLFAKCDMCDKLYISPDEKGLSCVTCGLDCCFRCMEVYDFSKARHHCTYRSDPYNSENEWVDD